MFFRKIRVTKWTLVLILCCLSCRSIDCQKASQHKSADQTASPDAAVTVASQKFTPAKITDEGLLLSNRDASSNMLIHGYMQADGRFFLANVEDCRQAVLLFRRLRPLAEGRLANRIDYRFMPDFGEGKSVIQEAYVEWRSIPYARLRAGKFKAPLGLEVLRSDRDLTFVERSMASDLIPLRELGAQLEGSVRKGTVTYAMGFFNGTEDGDNSNFEWHGAKSGVARVFLHPFATARHPLLQPLGVGLAASIGHNHGTPARFNTIGQETIFRYNQGIIADGQHRRLSPQASYFSGPIGVLAEYISSGGTLASGNSYRYLSHRGWEVAGSFFLTGEKNVYEDFRPAHALGQDMDCRHWGALELAVRHSDLRFDASAFPSYANAASSARSASESAFGINWHLNRRTKLMLDCERTEFRMATDSVPRLHAEHVAMTEIQFAL